MFVVKEVVKESPDMWTLKFESQKGVIFPYKPGQFGFFRIFGGHVKPEEHPFSISSDPSNKSTLSIIIKELGDYTSHIRNVQVGDKAHIDAPYGKFSHLNYPGEESLVLIAGGVGIAPFQSMLRYMRSNDRERRVILLWGVNDRRDLISMSEFEEMQKDMKNFHFVPVMFKDDSYEGEKGIIDRAKIENILKRYDHNIHDQGYYICGPYIMLKNVISSLKSLGVERNRIHYEKLTV